MDQNVLDFLLLAAVFFLGRGILYFMGKTLPKKILFAFSDTKLVRSWARLNGTVFLLWAVACFTLWAANMWLIYGLYFLGAAFFSLILSVVLLVRSVRLKASHLQR